MWFFKKKTDSNKAAIKSFTGRNLQYVSKRVQTEDGVRDMIVVAQAKCNILLSGNGATVEGVNGLNGEYEKIIVQYNKLK